MGELTVIREEVVVVRKDGGRGKDRAALKVWIVCVRRLRTWRRVRSWGIADGSRGDGWGFEGVLALSVGGASVGDLGEGA